jgi:2-dehydro-3-deoxyphosphogluconate aldolase/(4S)-4-hydroxy-2-oxoglutarate aldolase
VDHHQPGSEPDVGERPFRRGVVAVIRTNTTVTALTAARGLANTSVVGIEVTMTVPNAPKVIARLRSEGVQRVGAGTVRTLDQLKRCVDAGADFLVCPHLDPQLVDAAAESGVPIVPGALTPTEIMTAINLGVAAVKVFPVSAVGGHGYLRAVLEPLPDARLVVSGEVALAEVAGYLSVGAWAVCLGSSLWLCKEAENGDSDAVRRFAQHALQKAVDG